MIKFNRINCAKVYQTVKKTRGHTGPNNEAYMFATFYQLLPTKYTNKVLRPMPRSLKFNR
jgi:hypothetical protein